MTTNRVSELVAGDMIDLEGIDISEANEFVWPDEYAIVESVTTVGQQLGGWADGCITPETAIIYTDNGAAPAVVPADATFVVEAHREPFAGADAMEGQS